MEQALGNLAASGFGVALLPVSLDTTWQSDLTTVQLIDQDVTLPVVVVWRRSEQTAAIAAFVTTFKASKI